jgi:hypothetical protein
VAHRHGRLAPQRHVDDGPPGLLVQPPRGRHERLVTTARPRVVVRGVAGQKEARGDDGLGEEVRQEREQPRLGLRAAAVDDEAAGRAVQLHEAVHVGDAGGVGPESGGDGLGLVAAVEERGGEVDPRRLHHVVLHRPAGVHLVRLLRADVRQEGRRQDEEHGARDLACSRQEIKINEKN